MKGSREPPTTVEALLEEVTNFEPPSPSSKILVVDDEEIVREVLTEMLKTEYFPITTVPDGEEALKVIEEHQPRVVLVDKDLPGIGGLEVIRRGRDKSPDTEFIIITGYASLDSAIAAMDLGAFGYITKPFSDVSAVRKRVGEALERNRAVCQNRLLVERLRSAYEQLYHAKLELEMMADVMAGKLTQRTQELKDLFEEVLTPLLLTEQEDIKGMRAVLTRAAREGDPTAKPALACSGRLNDLFERLRARSERLMASLDVQSKS